MKHLWLISTLVVLLAAGTAPATVFLYEDFEGPLTDWWHLYGGLWHSGEDYRAHSGNQSVAFNDGGVPPSYDTGWWEYDVMWTPAVDVGGASAVYFDFWSWLETENPSGEWAYLWDTAYVQLYDADFNWYMDFLPDINHFEHEDWIHLGSSGDIKPILDMFGLTEFRLGFEFNTWDAVNNDYEGWYIDDLRIWDGEGAPPIPEPTTWLLLSSGILGIGAAARRRLFG